MWIDLLKTFVSGNLGISLALLLLVGLAAWRAWGGLVGAWRDPHPRWRLVGRLALGLQPALYLWVTGFDYWRQLLGLTLTEKTRYYSDPYVVLAGARHDVSDFARTISVALVFAGAVGLALLFYRHVGGPLLPLGTLVIGGLLYLFAGDARWRMNFWAATGFARVGQGTTGDLAVDVVFFTWVVLLDAAVALLLYLALAALLALPIVVVGGFFAERFVRPTPEYRRFSESLSARAAASRAARAAREEDWARPESDAAGMSDQERPARR
jgi:hypothetical protein